MQSCVTSPVGLEHGLFQLTGFHFTDRALKGPELCGLYQTEDTASDVLVVVATMWAVMPVVVRFTLVIYLQDALVGLGGNLL